MISPGGRRILVLVAVLLSTLTFPLTITGAALALPDIQADLSADLAATQWVVNAYNACFAGFLVLSGSLADVLGRRRVFATGIGLFCAGSLLCGVAEDIALLNALRAVAGIGAAAAVTGGSSLLAETFEGPARARAFGLLGTVLGAGTAFGPTVAGLLIDAFGWRAVFAAPAAVAGLVLALVPMLPHSRSAAVRRIDWPGAALFTTALLLLICTLVEGPGRGFGSPVILGAAVTAAALGVAFTIVERRRADPMFELGLLANGRFMSIAVAAGAIMLVLVPLLVYLPSYLITVVGLDAGRAGLWLLMLTVPTVLLPSAGAELARRLPTMPVVAGSVALSGAGALLLTTIGADSAPLRLLVPFLLIGAGAGLTNGLLDGLAISSVRPDQAGTASGMFNTVRITSETVGIAVVGAVLAALTGGALAGAAYTDALRTVCLLLAVLALTATVIVVVLSLRTRHPAGAGR
ncbi:MFS transporter [Marinactinospora rubrisoli]|uniref:MFS transporter n=1 Tax=Marinactinospora rubrisoli TaxID=2715399 RepID=A0ABW2KNG9_9ACTN